MSRETFRLSGKKIEIPSSAEGWAFETRPGGWSIATRARSDGTVERKRFFLFEAKGKLSFSIDGRLYHGPIETKAQGGTAVGGTDADLVAQFPGKVRKVLVVPGAKVETGTPLLLLEAMKMEFSVKAPFAGVVERVFVKEGQQLSPGDRFLDIKAKG